MFTQTALCFVNIKLAVKVSRKFNFVLEILRKANVIQD